MKNDTIKYFKILSSIPRESKNEKAVAEYLVSFAKEHNLYFYKDNFNNVLIKKLNENKSPIILHSHTDMVCVKEQDYNFDFNTMPLKLVEKDGFLSAYKTSLGADNGIGVAIILSLLSEDNNYNIEALFTTDEESTMTGALNFDYSLLSSNKLISLDGFSSTQLVNGCASICDMKINFTPQFLTISNKYERTDCSGFNSNSDNITNSSINNKTFNYINANNDAINNNIIDSNQNSINSKLFVNGYTLKIFGLKGGHSGADINKNVGNAINILTDILQSLGDVELSLMQGGNQFNFIPNFATATFFSKTFLDKIQALKSEYVKKYKDIKIEYENTNIQKVCSKEFSRLLLNVLYQIKTGVIISNEDDNIVLSQNLAYINLEEGLIKISERSHDGTLENKQIKFLQNLAENNHMAFEIYDKQSGLIPKNKELTQELCALNKKVNNENLEVITKHISVEGAIFKQKKPNLDIVVISPDIYDVHSTKERVYIPSINKTYSLLQEFLKQQ